MRKVAVYLNLLILFVLIAGGPTAAAAKSSVAFKQALAEAVASDRDVLAFYQGNGFEPIWTGRDRDDRKRRQALIEVLANVADHALPVARYQFDDLSVNLRSIRNDRDLGMAEAAFTQLFLKYARDVQSGLLKPSRVDVLIARKVPLRDRQQILEAFALSTPAAFMRQLPPQSVEYNRLMKHKIIMERVVERGGWGPRVPSGKYQPGDQGSGVIALRNRLIAMGYMERSAKAAFGRELSAGVIAFQQAHGLAADGVAGQGTIEAINVSARARLGSILAAMERERWTNMPRGARHVIVNIPDFSAAIIDNGQVTFKTRAVVGANEDDRRTPEFSDQIEYMVLNPSWFVPRSITVTEYLPLLQEDRTAVSNLNLIDDTGTIISRFGINFNAYTEEDFPFDLKEPPSQGNALGLVKFMFPNRYNIYLHDTPAKRLFGFQRRAFSHGCIRLAEPFEFAYALLARQSSDPRGVFHSLLATRQEATLYINERVPVHLIYRTAFTDARGQIHFRGDIYRRDFKIVSALVRAGVAIPAPGS